MILCTAVDFLVDKRVLDSPGRKKCDALQTCFADVCRVLSGIGTQMPDRQQVA